jgi:hypothetical protein
VTEATEATEAPAPIDAIEESAGLEDADSLLNAFRRQLEGQVSVPASLVQDTLLDLWGLLPEGDSRTQVERWLTETLERNLYAVSDIDARLSTVFSDN